MDLIFTPFISLLTVTSQLYFNIFMKNVGVVTILRIDQSLPENLFTFETCLLKVFQVVVGPKTLGVTKFVRGCSLTYCSVLEIHSNSWCSLPVLQQFRHRWSSHWKICRYNCFFCTSITAFIIN